MSLVGKGASVASVVAMLGMSVVGTAMAQSDVRVYPADTNYASGHTTTPPSASAQDIYYGPSGINLRALQTPEFYKMQGSRGDDARVAVIDTGVALTPTAHTKLGVNLQEGYDFASDPSDGDQGNSVGWDKNYADPGDFKPRSNSSWHGTHVTGVIAANDYDPATIAGVAPRADVMPIRALGKDGGSTEDLAAAIRWAAGGKGETGDTSKNSPYAGLSVDPPSKKADVINLSMSSVAVAGGKILQCGDTHVQSAINQAYLNDVTIVTAAGNSSGESNSYLPGNCANVINVGSVDRYGNISAFSNRGSSVDIYAPGEGIWSTYNNGLTAPGEHSFARMQGTSQAAPLVAGTATVMKAVNPNLTPGDIEHLIKTTARTGPSGVKILDTKAAVIAAIGTDPADNTSPADRVSRPRPNTGPETTATTPSPGELSVKPDDTVVSGTITPIVDPSKDQPTTGDNSTSNQSNNSTTSGGVAGGGTSTGAPVGTNTPTGATQQNGAIGSNASGSAGGTGSTSHNPSVNNSLSSSGRVSSPDQVIADSGISTRTTNTTRGATSTRGTSTDAVRSRTTQTTPLPPNVTTPGSDDPADAGTAAASPQAPGTTTSGGKGTTSNGKSVGATKGEKVAIPSGEASQVDTVSLLAMAVAGAATILGIAGTMIYRYHRRRDGR